MERLKNIKKMSGAKKYLEEHYNMESNITLGQYLRTYKNGNGNVDIWCVDDETYELCIGCLSYEDLTEDLKGLKVILINDSNIIVYISDKDKYIEYYDLW